MAEKGSFLFRTNPKMLAALKRWAADDFRSTNGQLEYVLRQALREAGRLNDDSNNDSASSDIACHSDDSSRSVSKW